MCVCMKVHIVRVSRTPLYGYNFVSGQVIDPRQDFALKFSVTSQSHIYFSFTPCEISIFSYLDHKNHSDDGHQTKKVFIKSRTTKATKYEN